MYREIPIRSLLQSFQNLHQGQRDVDVYDNQVITSSDRSEALRMIATLPYFLKHFFPAHIVSDSDSSDGSLESKLAQNLVG